ncbi:cyanase [Marinitenerispora sediminis]|uniref:Cyanate hydratase n=1 Tax=Marinitenerispora sediminis TaxID=1931232 RepID=A0A368T5E4_9ACTN|nr:cyanase [Marinitenerispora sediminis]RCV56379.1 cyanase [Marinitenerispora sediminis]RCV58714.1 cyanase [Marinitenerispora sediminis]
MDPIGRPEAARAVVEAKRRKNLTWQQIADELGRSRVWTTAALLGKHTVGREQAERVGKLLGLDDITVDALQLPPVRGAAGVDTSEPLVHRLEEIVQVYGGAISELVREEFGDGIMSAIDFEMDLERVPDPAGDRVRITLNGKFLPYREF